MTEILAYCQLLYIHSMGERERLLKHVTELDDCYLAHMAKKQADAPKK